MRKIMTSVFGAALACVALVFSAPVRAQEPFSVAPGFVVTAGGADPAPRPKSVDRFAACCEVWQMPDGSGSRSGGSGTCVACENGRSLVLTNNHVVSPGKGADGRFAAVTGQAVEVKHGGKRYPARVVAADDNLDVAAVVAEAELPVAEMADEPVVVGARVSRNGIGSGKQSLKVVATSRPQYPSPSMWFLAAGASESGDSGAAYFDEAGQVVAIHCGKDGITAASNPRGTPITPIRNWLREKVGKVLGRDRQAPANLPAAPAAPATWSVAPAIPLGYAPVTKRYTAVYRGGRLYYVEVPQSGCPNGKCPIPR
jgi:hypothetical protein